MALGKTYSTKYLADSNNNTGAANQVLVSTATGIDWVDGSASGIIGGPYLALSGGTLTGALTGTTAAFTGGISTLGQNKIDGSSDNLKISADFGSVSGSSTIEFLIDGSEKLNINNGGKSNV